MVAQIDRRYIGSRWQRIFPRLLAYTLFEGRPLTTRGRWINPLVFANLSLLKALPPMGAVDRPIFITGMGRSGTTILGVVLSMHKDVGFLNEPKAMWHAIYSGEDVVGNYTQGDASYRLHAEDCSKQTAATAHHLFAGYLRLGGNTRLVDKYPELVFRVGFVRSIFPDAKIIFLVRNGWDTCQSIMQWSQREGKEQGEEIHDWWGIDGRKWHLMVQQLLRPDPQYTSLLPIVETLDDHRLMAAVEWIITMREGLRQLQCAPEAVLMVRYEELISNPRETLRHITTFTELKTDEVMFSYATQIMRNRSSHHRFSMPEPIARLFEETMQMLGYHDDR